MKPLMENWRKYLKESSVVDIDDESGMGNVYGNIHDSMENVMNWAAKERLDGTSVEALKGLELPLAILKNINVDESARGQGIGGQLLEDFMSEAAEGGAYTVVLIADLGETQASGFDLEKWYGDYGFETVGRDAGNNPVMVMVQ